MADTTHHLETHEGHAHAHDHGHPTGWRRYVYSTNHKDIGTMYLVFAIIAGVIGTLLSGAMRLELQEPGIQIFHGLAAMVYGPEGALELTTAQRAALADRRFGVGGDGVTIRPTWTKLSRFEPIVTSSCGSQLQADTRCSGVGNLWGSLAGRSMFAGLERFKLRSGGVGNPWTSAVSCSR